MEHDTAIPTADDQAAPKKLTEQEFKPADDSDGQAVPSGTWSSPSSTLGLALEE